MSNQVRILKKFRSDFSSIGDVYLFLKIFFLVTILPILFKLFTIPGLLKRFTPKSIKCQKNKDLEKTKGKIVKFSDYILSRNFWIYKKNTCLKRSIVLYYYLRKFGIDVHICLGVKYNDELHNGIRKDSFIGHAWLTYKGNIFLERNVDKTKAYKMTYCFPVENNALRKTKV